MLDIVLQVLYMPPENLLFIPDTAVPRTPARPPARPPHLLNSVRLICEMTPPFGFGNVNGLVCNSGLHLDESFAKGTQFGRCIVHGVLLNGALSAVIARKLTGTYERCALYYYYFIKL